MVICIGIIWLVEVYCKLGEINSSIGFPVFKEDCSIGRNDAMGVLF